MDKKQFTSDSNVNTPEEARLFHCFKKKRNNCIENNCMAWRWWDEERGYCGLAGRPDGTKQ